MNATVSIEQEDERAVLVVRLAKGAPDEYQVDVLRKPLSDLIEVDQVLDWIPAWAYTGEPIIGCMVRSGLSALVGELIGCRRSTSELPWYAPRMKALGRCMLEHVPEMTKTAGLRAAKCIWRFGF